MKLEHLPPERLTALTTRVVTMLALLGLFGAIPPWLDYQDASAALRQQREALQRDHRDAARLPALEARYERVREELGALEPTSSRELFVPTLVRQLDDLASANGLELVATTPQPDDPADGPGPYAVDATLTGNWADLLSFVEALQTAPKAIGVASAVVDTDADNPPRIRIQLSLVSYETPGILAIEPADPEPPAEAIVRLGAPKPAIDFVPVEAETAEPFAPPPVGIDEGLPADVDEPFAPPPMPPDEGFPTDEEPPFGAPAETHAAEEPPFGAPNEAPPAIREPPSWLPATPAHSTDDMPFGSGGAGESAGRSRQPSNGSADEGDRSPHRRDAGDRLNDSTRRSRPRDEQPEKP